MANLTDLLINLATAGLKRYEEKTGLSGISEVVQPMVNEYIKDNMNYTLNPSNVYPMLQLVDVMQRNWNTIKPGEPIPVSSMQEAVAMQKQQQFENQMQMLQH